MTSTTSTPVADALQEVDQAGTEYGVPSAELLALRKLAGAVRSRGIGAELGQLREARTTAQPVAGALAGVDAAQGKPCEFGLGPEHELAALRDLADAVRGHLRPRYERAHCTGCGAWYLAGHGPGCRVGAAEADERELAAQADAEARTSPPPVPGVTVVDGHTVIAIMPGVRDLAWLVAAEALPGAWSAGHMFVEAGRLTYEPSGLYGSKRRALQVLAELAGIACVAPF